MRQGRPPAFDRERRPDVLPAVRAPGPRLPLHDGLDRHGGPQVPAHGGQALRRTRRRRSAIEIDVPLALTIMFSNFVWPIGSGTPSSPGDLVADKEEMRSRQRDRRWTSVPRRLMARARARKNGAPWETATVGLPRVGCFASMAHGLCARRHAVAGEVATMMPSVVPVRCHRRSPAPDDVNQAYAAANAAGKCWAITSSAHRSGSSWRSSRPSG